MTGLVKVNIEFMHIADIPYPTNSIPQQSPQSFGSFILFTSYILVFFSRGKGRVTYVSHLLLSAHTYSQNSEVLRTSVLMIAPAKRSFSMTNLVMYFSTQSLSVSGTKYNTSSQEVVRIPHNPNASSSSLGTVCQTTQYYSL